MNSPLPPPTSGTLWLRAWLGLRTFASDVGNGFVNISHQSFALLGVLAVFLCLLMLARPEVRLVTVQSVQTWLSERLSLNGDQDPSQQTLLRTFASDPQNLSAGQAALVQSLGRKYRIAAEPMSALVLEVYDLSARAQIDPLLILAVVAVESNFNPFAHSPMGAQGLMQVMPDLHAEQFTPYGGNLAIFDPVTNLRIGVKLLKESLAQRANVTDGLLLYKASDESAGLETGFISRVLTEQARLRQALTEKP